MVYKGEDDEEGGEEGSKAEEGAEEGPKVPSLGDYIMHCLSVFWKVLFAFVPPTGQCHRCILFTGICSSFYARELA